MPVSCHLGGSLNEVAADGEPQPLPGSLMGCAPCLWKPGKKWQSAEQLSEEISAREGTGTTRRGRSSENI